MGIQNRDYMKRPSDDDDPRSSTPDNKLEAFFSRFLQRYPKFFVYVGIALAALVIAVVVIVKLTSKSQ